MKGKKPIFLINNYIAFNCTTANVYARNLIYSQTKHLAVRAHATISTFTKYIQIQIYAYTYYEISLKHIYILNTLSKCRISQQKTIAEKMPKIRLSAHSNIIFMGRFFFIHIKRYTKQILLYLNCQRVDYLYYY